MTSLKFYSDNSINNNNNNNNNYNNNNNNQPHNKRMHQTDKRVWIVGGDHWEMRERMNFDSTDQWYMHTSKVLWDFEINRIPQSSLEHQTLL